MITGIVIWAVWMVGYLGVAALSVIAGAAMVTCVRRTWQQIRLDDDVGTHQRVLDGMERIETRLEALKERIDRMDEQRIGPGEGP
ncbi:MAG: hypothetical protein FJ207_09730 [Gemmatimonadetes bacterium]|nr:hypothetical protein [Gemmatimonadota bacterium]